MLVTNTNVINIYTHIDFYEKLRDSFFNTIPDYWNMGGTAVDYYYQFSTTPEPVVYGTLSEVVTYQGTEDLELVIEASSVVVAGEENDFLQGTLPEKIRYTDLTDTEPDPNPEAQIFYRETDVGPILPVSPEEVNVYSRATSLYTRVHSTGDTELLLVSDGVKTAMPNDVFKREVEKVVVPEFFDPNNSEPNGGWACAVVDHKMTYYNNPDFDYEAIVVNDSDLVFQDTTTEFVWHLTAPPLVYFSSISDNIYVDQNTGQTAAGYLTLDLVENMGKVQFTKYDVKDMRDPNFIIYMVDQDLNATDLIAIFDLDIVKQFPVSSEQVNIYDEGLISNLDIKLNLHWDKLVII